MAAVCQSKGVNKKRRSFGCAVLAFCRRQRQRRLAQPAQKPVLAGQHAHRRRDHDRESGAKARRLCRPSVPAGAGVSAGRARRGTSAGPPQRATQRPSTGLVKSMQRAAPASATIRFETVRRGSFHELSFFALLLLKTVIFLSLSHYSEKTRILRPLILDET